MAKKIEVSLLQKGRLEKAIKKVEDFRDVEIPKMCQEFVSRLASEGIYVATNNATNQFAPYVYFYKKVENPTKDGCRAIVVAQEISSIISDDGREVSPLLMLEYGSGLYAESVHWQIQPWTDVGRGTFPMQTHAWNPKGWWYLGNDGIWHHSYGIHPQAPMWKAYEEMENQKDKIARKVFK